MEQLTPCLLYTSALLSHVKDMLDHVKEEHVVFEKEYMIKEPDFSNEPYTVEKSEEEEGLYIVEGPDVYKRQEFPSSQSYSFSLLC